MAANPLKAAILRSYETLDSGIEVATGNGYQEGVAFDGEHIWVSSYNNGWVRKIRASDATIVGTALVPNAAGLAFDGAHLWVGGDDGFVTKVRASDGEVLSRIEIGGMTRLLVFDGANIWATAFNGNTVAKIRAKDGTVLGTYPAGENVMSIGFDGQNIWVGNGYQQQHLTKLNAATGSIIGTYLQDVVWFPSGFAFDGGYLWVADAAGYMTKLLPDSATVVARVQMLGYHNLVGPVFDGRDLWVFGQGPGTVPGALLRIRPDNGTVFGPFTVCGGASAMASDGANLWIGCHNLAEKR